jgi:hypothetical protein
MPTRDILVFENSFVGYLAIMSRSAAVYVGQLPKLLATAICLSELLAPRHPIGRRLKSSAAKGDLGVLYPPVVGAACQSKPSKAALSPHMPFRKYAAFSTRRMLTPEKALLRTDSAPAPSLPLLGHSDLNPDLRSIIAYLLRCLTRGVSLTYYT